MQPSIPATGGLGEARRIATLAHAHNLRVAPHVWGGAVGLATACHFIASLPATPHTDHPPYPLMLEYDMSDNALRTQLLKTPLRLEPTPFTALTIATAIPAAIKVSWMALTASGS